MVQPRILCLMIGIAPTCWVTPKGADLHKDLSFWELSCLHYFRATD